MKTRIRKNQFTGDVPKRFKIQMWEHPTSKADKVWKKVKLMKERAVIARQTRQEIIDQCTD